MENGFRVNKGGKGIINTAALAPGAVTGSKLSTSQLGKNYIINGNFNIWQRVSSNSTANAYGPADRFCRAENGVAANTLTLSQETTIVPTGSYASLKAACPNIDASIAAGDLMAIRTTIEGTNTLGLSGKYVTLSFWVYSNKIGQYAVRLSNLSAAKSYVAPYIIHAASTWEKKVVTLFMDTSVTLDKTNGVGLYIDWCLAGGTTYQVSNSSLPSNAWVAGNFYTNSGQVNFLDTNTNVFYLAQVQLEEGQEATAFEYVDIATELVRCQRYYQKSYTLTTSPGTATFDGSHEGVANGSINRPIINMPFRVEMRIKPTTVTFYAPSTGTPAKCTNITGGSADTNVTIERSATTMCSCYVAATPTTNDLLAVHFVAEAEL